jgi:hypothetical protein
MYFNGRGVPQDYGEALKFAHRRPHIHRRKQIERDWERRLEKEEATRPHQSGRGR